MDHIKRVFSIKDLENLSGIKAHTIRIWEKRYNLLSPMRTNTNIRSYSLESLQKLLNITLLYQNGYKISKIAALSEAGITQLAKDIVNEKSEKNQAINAFKIAMINYDGILFQNTYASLLETKSFRAVFYDIFIPLLNELGLLWQTATITPAHEHFVSNLIKQKILIHTEQLYQQPKEQKPKTFVLYLPENEIHEIGLLFLNYELMLQGYQTVYLGASMPIENLKDLSNYYEEIVFLTYFTVAPPKAKLTEYIEFFANSLLGNKRHQLWMIGKQLETHGSTAFPEQVHYYPSLVDLVKKL